MTTTTMSRWIVPAAGLVLGLLIAAALLGNDATPIEAAVAFLFVAGYGIALRLLQSRSDMASVLSGLPRDERWESINLRALSVAAQVLAVVLVGAFLLLSFNGGDSTPYAWLGLVFALAYLAGLIWYRARS